jgi:hypothetical protein
MNSLITEANSIIKNGFFEYAFCGGFAVELFLDKKIRSHNDIDVSAYWNERDKIILYMQSLNWNVYEMCGGGMVHHITDINNQLKLKKNICCFKDDYNPVSLIPQNEKGMYQIDFDNKEQKCLNFIEFLFNNKSDKNFIYDRNDEITLPLSRAVLYRNDIPYLAPEMVLLYKSTDINREGYQLDFISTIAKMDKEEKNWLKNALLTTNPAGHLWIEKCE